MDRNEKNIEKNRRKVNGRITCPYENPLPIPEEGVLEHLEGLYAVFRSSVPNEGDRRIRREFYALPSEKLTQENLLYGTDRNYAYAELTVPLLLHILSGNLVWQESYGKWFWKSKKHPDFIILRD